MTAFVVTTGGMEPALGSGLGIWQRHGAQFGVVVVSRALTNWTTCKN